MILAFETSCDDTAVALVSGYKRAFEISALITFVALLVSFALPRHTGRRQTPSITPPAE